MKRTNIRTLKERAANQEGFALVVAMGILTLLLLATLALTTMTNQSAFRVRRINRDARALACAEAGIADMISKLSADYLAWENNSISVSNFAGGAYAVVSEKKPITTS
jgi:Tfp pilus assembly protein PilX